MSFFLSSKMGPRWVSIYWTIGVCCCCLSGGIVICHLASVSSVCISWFH